MTYLLPKASATTPLVDGTAAVGVSTAYARADHVHASDPTRAPLASPVLSGIPTAPTAAAGGNAQQLATAGFVVAALAVAMPATAGLLAAAGAAGNTQAATAAQLTAAMAAWFLTLPTTLPGTAGQPWNNGRTLAFS